MYTMCFLVDKLLFTEDSFVGGCASGELVH